MTVQYLYHYFIIKFIIFPKIAAGGRNKLGSHFSEKKSLKYLFDVSKRSIEQASKNNNELQNIVQFVIKSIITRITKKIIAK